MMSTARSGLKKNTAQLNGHDKCYQVYLCIKYEKQLLCVDEICALTFCFFFIIFVPVCVNSRTNYAVARPDMYRKNYKQRKISTLKTAESQT